MKIGKFAEKFGVSRDTVRFYIRSGLLIPDESGAQLEFGERECRAMESILRMRQQKFSLRQIKRYLDIRRVSSMAEAASLEEILELSDRIAVLFGGRIAGILDRRDATEQKLGLLMGGIEETEVTA